MAHRGVSPFGLRSYAAATARRRAKVQRSGIVRESGRLRLVRDLERARTMEFFALIGGGLLLISLPGLAYPALVGWKSRRDAVVALLVSAAMLGAVLLMVR